MEKLFRFQVLAFVGDAMPLVRIGRTRALTSDGRPLLGQFCIKSDKFLLTFRDIIFVENSLFGAFRHANRAVNAFVGINHQKVGTDTEAVNRTHCHTGRVRAINTWVTNYMSHSFLPTENISVNPQILTHLLAKKARLKALKTYLKGGVS